jgi:glycosyltransferase 2 family protein
MGKKNLKTLSFFLKLTIAILLFWYLYKSKRLTLEGVSQLSYIQNLPYFLLSGMAYILSQMLSAARFQLLLKIIDTHLPYLYILRLTLVGNFFNIVIPGVFGGDIIKGIFLIKNEEKNQGRTSGIILMDRIIGVLSLVVLGGLSVFYLYIKKIDKFARYETEMSMMLTFSTLFLILFIFFILIAEKKSIRQKVESLASRFLKKTIFYNILQALGSVTNCRKILLFSFLISLFIQLVSLVGVLIFLNLFPEKTQDLMLLFSISSVVFLFGVLPITPGNLGWIELVASIGWSTAGSRLGGNIFFLWRIVTVALALPGGLLFFLPQYKKKRKQFLDPHEGENVQNLF